MTLILRSRALARRLEGWPRAPSAAILRDAAKTPLLRMRSESCFRIKSIAPANPSSSLEAVTCDACLLTSSVALPIAMERPLVRNIARSFCMSPIVAIAAVEMLRRRAIASHKRALVVARRGDIEIIALRLDRGCLRAHCLPYGGLAALQQLRIGTGADNFAGTRHIRRKIPDDGRIGPDGAYFIRDIFTIAIAREPGIVGEQPDIDTEFVQQIEAALSRGRGDQVLFDRVQLRIDNRTAVERPDRQRDPERLDQESHAGCRTAADDSETDARIC